MQTGSYCYRAGQRQTLMLRILHKRARQGDDDHHRANCMQLRIQHSHATTLLSCHQTSCVLLLSFLAFSHHLAASFTATSQSPSLSSRIPTRLPPKPLNTSFPVSTYLSIRSWQHIQHHGTLAIANLAPFSSRRYLAAPSAGMGVVRMQGHGHPRHPL